MSTVGEPMVEGGGLVQLQSDQLAASPVASEESLERNDIERPGSDQETTFTFCTTFPQPHTTPIILFRP